MQFTQKIRFGYTQTRFEFCDTQLDYYIRGETVNFGFRINYENIPKNISLQTYSEQWPTYVGIIFWIFWLPVFVVKHSGYVFWGLSNSAYQVLSPLLITLAVIFILLGKRRFSNDAKQLKTRLGTIIVLSDKYQQTILDEIDCRRRAAIKKKFADINPLNDPALELSRFKTLLEDGIISDEEFSITASKLTITAA